MADPVALQIQSPNAMTTLGNIMNIATQQQALKKAQATYESDVARNKAESDVSVQTAAPRIEQQQQAAAQAKITTASHQYKLDAEQSTKALEIAGALVQDPAIVNGDSEGAVNALMEAKDRMIAFGIPKHKAEVQVAPLMAMAAHNPKGLQQVLKNIIVGGQAAGQQSGTVQPSGPVLNNGQQQQGINTNVFATQQQGPIPAVQAQNQLPPTTPTIDPNTNVPGYVGSQGPKVNLPGHPANVLNAIEGIKDPEERAAVKAAYRQQLGGGPKPIQSGPALGTHEAIAGTVEGVNKDWLHTQNAASTAAQDISVLQNIKKYAPGAVTGVTGDRRAFVAGLAGLLGMDEAQLEKTDTDLLAKNSNMLALAGGDTNLAKTMAEAANPNTHMTPEAISKAADQVIAQRKMALAKQSILRTYKARNDINGYNEVLAEFNKSADPRILQLRDMSAEDKARMKASMSPAEQKEFGNKIRKMQEMGVVE